MVHAVEPLLLAGPRLDRESALPGRDRPGVEVQIFADLRFAPKADETSRREHHGVEFALGHTAEAGVDVAPNVDHLQVGTAGQQLRSAPGRPGADSSAGGEGVDRLAVVGAEDVPRIHPLRHGSDDEPGVRSRRKVFEGMHEGIALRGEQGVAQRGGEDARAADRGKRVGCHIAGRDNGHDLDTCPAGALEGLPHRLRLREGEGAAARADPEYGRRVRGGRHAINLSNVLVCLSANHRNTSFDVLERLSTVAADVSGALTADGGVARGAVLLATCNRFEAYLDVATDVEAAADQTFAALAAASAVDEAELRRSITVLSAGRATSHLFAVTSGLESVVVGEDEISGQVSRALGAARLAGTTTSALEAVFQHASRTSRWVKASSSLGAAGRSIVRRALELAAVPDWSTVAVLIVGTGQYAATTVAALRNHGAADLRVYSPSGRGTVFAAKYHLPLELDLVEAVTRADVVITCTGAFVIGTKHVVDDSPRVVIDLGMPRNVDPAIAGLPGVELFDLERIRLSAPAEDASGAARTLVGEAAARYDAEVSVEPAVVALRAHVAALVDAEIARARAKGSSSPETEAALRRLASVFLHEPSARARGLALDGRVDEVTAAISALFGVEPPTE